MKIIYQLQLILQQKSHSIHQNLNHYVIYHSTKHQTKSQFNHPNLKLE